MNSAESDAFARTRRDRRAARRRSEIDARDPKKGCALGSLFPGSFHVAFVWPNGEPAFEKPPYVFARVEERAEGPFAAGPILASIASMPLSDALFHVPASVRNGVVARSGKGLLPRPERLRPDDPRSVRHL